MSKFREKTVCFTGHRKIRTIDKNLRHILYKTIELLIKRGYMYFGTGGAKGFDLIAAETILLLKKKYPHIHLILVLPFVNQYEKEGNWTEYEIELYHSLKQRASKIVHIQDKYSLGCYYKRDRHMVDSSSICVCYQYKSTGCTAYTTNYARNIGGIKIINIIDL